MNAFLYNFSDDFFCSGFLISSFNLSAIYSPLCFPPRCMKHIQKNSLEISSLQKENALMAVLVQLINDAYLLHQLLLKFNPQTFIAT